MARAEENIRRFSMSNSALNTVYMDQLIDVSDISTSSVLYDFNLTSPTSNEDISSSIITLPSMKSSKKLKIEKLTNMDRLYYCNFCGTSFSNSSNLKSHLRIHTGEKPFTCEVCSASFVQSSNLKAHKRIHTGEKPYKCSFCNKCFARSAHLIGHKRIHTGEMPYSCSICEKSFSSSTQLKKHTEKHSAMDAYICSHCDKTFSKKSALSIHLKMHSLDRPFVCVLCTAAFRSRDDLNVHRKLHSGDEYPYSCSVCGKGFKIKLCCEKHAEKCAQLPKLEENNGKNNDFLLNFLDSIRNSTDINLDQYDMEDDDDHCQVFQFDEAQGLEGICKMELLEGSIEDGIDFEVEEQMMVFTNEGGNSILQVIPANCDSQNINQ